MATVPRPDSPGKGDVTQNDGERTEKQVCADLRLMTNAVKRWPARVPPKVLSKMAEEGWKLVTSSKDDRAKVHALKFLQALIAMNAKLAMKAYDKRVKGEGGGEQGQGGTCIKVYNNLNILNV